MCKTFLHNQNTDVVNLESTSINNRLTFISKSPLLLKWDGWDEFQLEKFYCNFFINDVYEIVKFHCM